MASTGLLHPRRSFLCVLLLLRSTGALLVEQDTRELTCSQGLSGCRASPALPYGADPDGEVEVTGVELEVKVCCGSGGHCDACLKITITIRVAEAGERRGTLEASGDNEDQSGDGSGRVGPPPKPRAPIKVCLNFPDFINFCKALKFTLSASLPELASPQPEHELLLTEKVPLGSTVMVLAYSKWSLKIQNTTVPSLGEVCSMNLPVLVSGCDVPTLRVVTDYQRNEVRLQLENSAHRKNELMWRMFRNGMPGEVQVWPKDKGEIILSSILIIPCLCFEVWWRGRTFRRSNCPFRNQTDALERMRRGVSVSVAETRLRGGGLGLTWNVSAPCSLEAEVWLCKKGAPGGRCVEVSGSRQTLDNHTGWKSTRNGHWKTGDFNASPHPLLCVQMKIHGMETHLEPKCLFETARWRWSLAIFLGLLLVCLAIVAAYLIQGILKGYVWRWLKEEDVKGAVGGGHVVLLCPPDDDAALPRLLSHLGSSLQALGFSVSLDLWSQTELAALGPIPWLHSQLDRLQRQGGKVVLVLTRAAWIRAEEWGARSFERNASRETSRDTEMEEEEEEGEGGRNATPLHCFDVFTASLSSILADYLQGRAGERFVLVQFESLPPEPPGGCRLLPELFRGLHLYSLPSQSLGFLTELAGARRPANASARRKRAGGIRMASRALARGLSGFTAGTSVLSAAGVSQGCVGGRAEDSGETVPLQPPLVTPPSSPDWSGKVSEVDYV